MENKREGSKLTEMIADAKKKGLTSDEILNALEKGLAIEELKKEAEKSENPFDIRNEVTELMLELGVPSHIKGHAFLRTAIVCSVENPSMRDSVTKILYPTVAKMHNTTSSRVERAIRHAIEVAWDRGDWEVMKKYFGYTVDQNRGKPTNSEFIWRLVDVIQLKNR